MTDSAPNAAQRLKAKVTQARLPAAQKKMKAIIDEMEAATAMVRQYPGPFDAILIALLESEGFKVTTRVDKGRGACDCDYTQTCNNHDQTWVTVSVPE